MGNPTGIQKNMNSQPVTNVSRAAKGEFDHGGSSNSAYSALGGPSLSGNPARSNRSGIVPSLKRVLEATPMARRVRGAASRNWGRHGQS